jgi:hypothetical protein
MSHSHPDQLYELVTAKHTEYLSQAQLRRQHQIERPHRRTHLLTLRLGLDYAMRWGRRLRLALLGTSDNKHTGEHSLSNVMLIIGQSRAIYTFQPSPGVRAELARPGEPPTNN